MSAGRWATQVSAICAVIVQELFVQVASEYCGDNKYCQPPYKCCENALACCYDHDSSYSRGFRLHVWNMWYFWLVIIFILMSCFGGCGYYRRRRLAALQQSAETQPSRCHVTHERCTSTRQSYYAYTGPGADPVPDVLHRPPPYTEVMNQPNLYPVNKVDLPPYPGPPSAKGESSSLPGDTIHPPPYSELTPSMPVSLGDGSLHQSALTVSVTHTEASAQDRDITTGRRNLEAANNG